MKKIILLCLLLSSCATPLKVTTEPVPVVINHPPAPEPIQLTDVNWQVVTAANMTTFIDQAKTVQSTDNPTFVVLSVDDFKTLMVNMADIKRYIQQQKSIIAYYDGITGDQLYKILTLPKTPPAH